jgi:polyketide synthase PksL
LAAQGLERLRARYDIVLAGNVLHATPDVAQALSNAKALLAPGGVLVLHELSQPSAAAHATFGLLDGWWLYTDSHVRQANSPLVAPHQWRELLTAQGFAPVKFPAQAAHALGHQIVCAQNEGPLQLADTQPQDDIGLDDKSLELAKAQILHAQSGSVMGDAELTVRLQQMLAASVAKLLQLGSQELDADTPLMEYGFDSISMAHWTDLLNTRFELGLLPTVLFEHPTLAGLTGYLVAHHREGLAQHFAAHGEHAAKPMRQAEPARPPQAPAPTIIQAQAPRPSLGPGPQGAELARHVNQALAASVAQLLQLKLSELDADTPLMEYGFDSISIAHWTDSLNTRFELGLLPTVLFEHPTLAGLTGYLVAHHGPQLARHFASEERAPAQQLALLNQRSSYAIH